MLDIRYAKSAGASIAYHVVGAAEVDLVYVPEFVSNLVYGWELSHWREFYEGFARSFRLIRFDKRGTGLSDGGGQFATLETRMEDLGAVLDAVGSERAVIFSGHEGCSMATLYAATYPERVVALALFQPVARRGWGADEEAERAELRRLRDEWGTQEWCDELLREGAPSLADSDDHREWFANGLRVGASPAVAYALNLAFYETDLVEVLPAVRVPTLVLYRGGENEDDALDVARRIPSAQAVRVPGDDYFGAFTSPEIVDEIERFVAGEPAPVVPDSVLATVMFTDIVGSTGRAAELGDTAWRQLLDEHNALVRRELARFRGEERDTAGDGFFATFDGPARAIRCAQAIVEGVRSLGLEVRVGVHAGECERIDGKLGGIAVSTGARIGALAGAGEVLVSSTVKDLVAGSGLEFEEHGTHELKGVPGEWRLYAVRGS
ncbi:MAG TPA: adenylate/guanylate cyclase domain-containing protein [Gaiellaceae bacterium]|nr:adenylate/guanylate cyclase domain-containing protein [Gaiellaceae bacterium]